MLVDLIHNLNILHSNVENEAPYTIFTNIYIFGLSIRLLLFRSVDLVIAACLW